MEKIKEKKQVRERLRKIKAYMEDGSFFYYNKHGNSIYEREVKNYNYYYNENSGCIKYEDYMKNKDRLESKYNVYYRDNKCIRYFKKNENIKESYKKDIEEYKVRLKEAWENYNKKLKDKNDFLSTTDIEAVSDNIKHILMLKRNIYIIDEIEKVKQDSSYRELSMDEIYKLDREAKSKIEIDFSKKTNDYYTIDFHKVKGKRCFYASISDTSKTKHKEGLRKIGLLNKYGDIKIIKNLKTIKENFYEYSTDKVIYPIIGGKSLNIFIPLKLINYNK